MITMTWPQYLRGECQVSGFVVKLSPTEAEVLLQMLLRYPRDTLVSEIIEAIWPNPDEEPAWPATEVYRVVSRIRFKIGAYRIQQCGFRGYALLQEPPLVRRRRKPPKWSRRSCGTRASAGAGF